MADTGPGFKVVGKYDKDRFPEHAKLHEISNLSQAIGEFLDWCSDQGWTLAEIPDGYEHTWFPIHRSTTQLLAEHFGIDTAKIEQEKRTMLDQIRQDNHA